VLARLFVYFQYLLPRHLLTALVYHVSRMRQRSVKNFLINSFSRLYDVNLDEVALRTPVDFRDFNAFFTRELVSGMRPVDKASTSIVSPVDGTVSMAGKLVHDSLIQAKGVNYSLQDLFAVDLASIDPYIDGRFATIYLAPHNYHRVHMPYAGELVAAHYVPGDLFSVNEATVAHVRGLFRRNERLVLHFATDIGPLAVVFVGALNVGSISTPWSGVIRPRKRGIVESLELGEAERMVPKGGLLGWFNMGSTVIVLLPAAAAEWLEEIDSGSTVRMGEPIARVARTQEQGQP
jgi:phosphatidylserine decarboxylase